MNLSWRRSVIFISLIFFTFLLYTGVAAADELVLNNGDRLTGKIGQMTQDTLVLTTSYSGPIRIRREKIRIIHTDEPVEVHLKNGEVLRGRLTTDEDGRMHVDSSPAREKTAVALPDVAAINPPHTDPVSWKGALTVGGNLQSGNTKRSSAAVSAEATRKTERDRVGLRIQFNYAKDENAMTARNTYGALKYDYFFTKSLFGYLSVELLNDKFKDLNLRTIVGPGAGYQIWDDPVKSLLLEAGLAYVSEDLRKAEDEQYITARLGGNLSIKFLDLIVFKDQLIIYPSLKKVGQYKLRNEAGLTSPLAAGWALSLMNIIERNSNPPEEIRKNDISWILGLQYNF